MVTDVRIPIENLLFGLFFFMLGMIPIIYAGICVDWLYRHPVQLIFDDAGCSGPRVYHKGKPLQIAWENVASTKLEQWRNPKREVVGADITLQLKSGGEESFNAYHLNYAPSVIFEDLNAFINRKGYRLAKEVEPEEPVSLTNMPLVAAQRFRIAVAQAKSSDVKVYKVEANMEAEASASAMLAGDHVISVEAIN